MSKSVVFLNWVVIWVSLGAVSHLIAGPLTLANLEYSNPSLKNLRSEIKENLRISKSGTKKEILIPLKYYEYKVQKEDNFFKIMARTGMDLETLSSVNELSSPHDLSHGMVLEIPNMRGTFHPEETDGNEKTKQILAEKYQVDANKLQYDPERGKWFLPGISMGKSEKSFFYGFGFQFPLTTARISSNFGKRLDPFTKKETFHGGLDMAAKQGSDVYSSMEGEVSFVGNQGGYGNLIIIKHSLGYETRYGHLLNFAVKQGQKVKKGEKIGEVGQTGRATGPHLHFEIRRNSKRQRPIFHSH
ncbi:M23 family metallopeptidase [Leptospira biflexa]|uniref:LysM peptidoglycan-binding domain-containing M23 family metallopeptidase n=1 Tax=Leptospira biflexa TaxID=172 RepID=UPI0010838FC8|nr:M23 family metallopeptidase [Leptospira biflexa]TGM37366.1 M23 family metallopeptidase [Leptospira biflexa]TGM40703.1 M23 family metallopeptidase [Leptospira biflexa]TGM46907.1 M23 family metallopeptidase [Leptospira biflexa]TGM50627.1 M23 family metallopeptidase [Leptospira biflexa]TGM55901.1 M23 family metallopeptidase [Leptospira biflexa]